MSLLSVRPDSEFFQTIPDLHDAVHTFKDNGVKSKLEHFGRIFVKHGVEQEFGLVMVHRHFDISKDEILVETLNDENSISVTSPWIIKNETILAPDNETLWMKYDTKMKQYVVPQTWSYDKHGNLKPFEYLSSDVLMEFPAQVFVSELYSELKALGLERNLGVRRIVNYRGRKSWETTPQTARSNVVVFETRPENVTSENVVPVLWYFNEHGKLYQGAYCTSCPVCYHCYGHCVSHCEETAINL